MNDRDDRDDRDDGRDDGRDGGQQQTDRLGLDAFDAIAPPEQWSDIVNRAEAPSIERGRRRPVWMMVAAAAAMVLVAGIALSSRDGGPSPSPATDPIETLPSPATTLAVDGDDAEDAAPSTTSVSVPTSTPPPATSATTPPTMAPTTVGRPPAVGASPWNPECAERLGASDVEPGDDSVLTTFDGLGAVPTLDIRLAGFGDQPPAGVWAEAAVLPGGVLVVERGTETLDEAAGTTRTHSVVAAVDLDGSVRWRRCFDGDVPWSTMVAPVEDRPTTAWLLPNEYPDSTATLFGLDLATGRTVEPAVDVPNGFVTGTGRFVVIAHGNDGQPVAEADRIVVFDTVEASVVEVPYPAAAMGVPMWQVGVAVIDSDSEAVVRAMIEGGDAWVFAGGEWSQDAAALASFPGTIVEAVGGTFDRPTSEGLQYVDGAGDVVWTVSDYAGPNREGFRSIATDQVVVVANCQSRNEDGRCVSTDSGFAIEHLVAYDTATGEELWRDPDGGAISLAGGTLGISYYDDDGDGLTDGAELIDLLTGDPVADRPVTRWPDVGFGTECCGGDLYYRTEQYGGVVIQKIDDHLLVWYPPAVSTPTFTVDVMG